MTTMHVYEDDRLVAHSGWTGELGADDRALEAAKAVATHGTRIRIVWNEGAAITDLLAAMTEPIE